MCILTAVLATGQVISNIVRHYLDYLHALCKILMDWLLQYEFTHSVAITTSVPSATCVSHLESSIHLQTM